MLAGWVIPTPVRTYILASNRATLWREDISFDSDLLVRMRKKLRVRPWKEKSRPSVRWKRYPRAFVLAFSSIHNDVCHRNVVFERCFTRKQPEGMAIITHRIFQYLQLRTTDEIGKSESKSH